MTNQKFNDESHLNAYPTQPAPPLQIPESDATENLHNPKAPADDDSSSTSTGGRTLPSANNVLPFVGSASMTTPSSSAAAAAAAAPPSTAPSPNLRSTSRYSPSDAGLESHSSLQSLHHLRRR